MSNTILTRDDFSTAADVIHNGGVVAFPTETYYGLAVDPFNEKALHKLFDVKGRPGLKPVLLLIADRSQLAKITISIPHPAEKLMDRFWPGPLTLVLPARPDLSPYVTGNTGTVGVRLSPHPAAAALLDACGIPITATSANRSLDNPAVTAAEVGEVFSNRIDLILDGGRTPGRHGSTLVGFAEGGIQCIREGSIPFRKVRAAVH